MTPSAGVPLKAGGGKAAEIGRSEEHHFEAARARRHRLRHAVGQLELLSRHGDDRVPAVHGPWSRRALVHLHVLDEVVLSLARRGTPPDDRHRDQILVEELRPVGPQLLTLTSNTAPLLRVRILP